MGYGHRNWLNDLPSSYEDTFAADNDEDDEEENSKVVVNPNPTTEDLAAIKKEPKDCVENRQAMKRKSLETSITILEDPRLSDKNVEIKVEHRIA